MTTVEANIIRKYCMIESKSAQIGNELGTFINNFVDDFSTEDLGKLIQAKTVLTQLHLQFTASRANLQIKELQENKL